MLVSGPKLWSWSRLRFGEKEGIKSHGSSELKCWLFYPLQPFIQWYMVPFSLSEWPEQCSPLHTPYRCFNMHIINSKPRQIPVPQTSQSTCHSAGPREVFGPSHPGIEVEQKEWHAQLSCQLFLQRDSDEWCTPQFLQKPRRGRNQTGWVGEESSKERQNVGLMVGKRWDLKKTLQSRLGLENWRKGSSMCRGVWPNLCEFKRQAMARAEKRALFWESQGMRLERYQLTPALLQGAGKWTHYGWRKVWESRIWFHVWHVEPVFTLQGKACAMDVLMLSKKLNF